MQYGDPATTGTTLTFDAEPLDTDQVVAGPVGATIYAKSSTRNLNLIATLNDVVTRRAGEPAGDRQPRREPPRRRPEDLVARHGRTDHPPHPSVPGRRLREAEHAPALRHLTHADAVLGASGHHLQLVLSSQPPASKCASLLSALTIPLPCLPSAPQQDTLAGGEYTIVWSKSSPSSVNVPLIDAGTLPEARAR